MVFSKRIKNIIIFGLIIIAFVFIVFIFYAVTASIRYTSTSEERSQIIEAGKEQNVKELNTILDKTKALDSKLAIMSYLKEFQDEYSIPILIKHLNYTLPWWDKLDTELKDRPINIRMAAYRVLLSYDKNIARELKNYLSKDNRLRRLYLTAIFYKKGICEKEDLIMYLNKLGNHYEKDVQFLIRDLKLKKYL